MRTTLLLLIFALSAVAQKPNLVILLCDNLGYGDIGSFGSTLHRTPHIDRMAEEGLRLTSFYSTSGVCTPSRSSLMTACYPRRVGMHMTDPDLHVLRPVSPNGLNPDEITIAEVLKKAGYATACIGKWHLGDQPRFLPTRQGFDFYYGIPGDVPVAGDWDGDGCDSLAIFRPSEGRLYISNTLGTRPADFSFLYGAA
ncbi:MAG: sulfatase-like hydrolase/transferase, partial [bacterium]|nr:sulfatase-like hydrolase/transferase [bacterium]